MAGIAWIPASCLRPTTLVFTESDMHPHFSALTCQGPFGGEKGPSHVEDQQAAVNARKLLLPRVRLVERSCNRWRAAVAGVRHRLLFPLLLALAGCGAAQPFTLRVAVVGPLEPLTPDVSKSASQLVADLVYQGLLTPNEQGETSPELARAWHPLPAGHVWIELDTRRRFSDGSPITLQDVIASLKAAGLSAIPCGSGLDVGPAVRGVSAELALTRTAIFKTTPGGFIGSGAFVVVQQDRERVLLASLPSWEIP